MAPSGRGKVPVLFVAEAPGENEDRLGTQLIGDAGQCLRKMLKGIGEDLEDATKTNAIICRPPRNKIADVHIESCRPNLIATVQELKPKVIILLGMSAVKSLIGREWGDSLDVLTKWVGWTIPVHRYGAWVCPTFHPSYVLRMNEDPTLVMQVKQHLRAAYRMQTKELPDTELKTLEKKVEIIRSAREARLRLRDLSQKAGRLAFDYETTGLKPDSPVHRIVSCSFCLEGKDTFACMIDDSTRPLLSRVLQNPDLLKIASNMKFEERWTMAKLGHPVAGWWWDTMLAAHVLDNRQGITSIKFLSFINFGIGDYNSKVKHLLRSETSNGVNRIDEIPADDLLLYNGLDSLLEYKMAIRQRKILYGAQK
jgi:DNA polymerase